MYDINRSAHITDTLVRFHWLRVPERIKFKLAVIVYRALHGTVPRYLTDMMLRRVTDVPSRSRLRSSTSSSNQLVVRPSRSLSVSVNVRLLRLARGSGTVFRTTLRLQSLPEFRWKLKLLYLGNYITFIRNCVQKKRRKII